MQESVDETIERFRRDRQMIKDRMNERNELFARATQNYMQNISKEIEIIQKAQKVAESRNQEFKEQINNLYNRYESGGEILRQAIQKTNIEKYNYNNYLIKVYPHTYTAERQKLVEENQKLQHLIRQLKPQVSDQLLPEDDDQFKQQDSMIDMQGKLDHFNLGQDDFQPQKIRTQPSTQQPKILVTQPPKGQQQQDEDLLSDFLLKKK